MKKQAQQKTMVCQISIYSDRPRFRIEGDYIPNFYQMIKELVPGAKRAWIAQQKYWLIDKSYFCRVFELAYEHYDKIQLFENGKAEEYEPRKVG